MTDTPTPRRAGNRKVLAFVIGGLLLIAAVAVAFFSDRVMGSAGMGMAPPAASTGASTTASPIANPAEPGAPTAPASAAPAP